MNLLLLWRVRLQSEQQSSMNREMSIVTGGLIMGDWNLALA